MSRGSAKEPQPATDRPQHTGTPDAGSGAWRAARRRAVLSGHGAAEEDGDVARVLAGDPDPSVRGAALGALARLDEIGTIDLVHALADPEPMVRDRASRIAGALASREESARRHGALLGTLLGALVGALEDSESAVAETSAWALGEWGSESAGAPVEALCEMARAHSDPLCREAAVAALGAIGAARALHVILGALDDRPAVRRRAAIALAAFEDPAAEEGLRRCLDDRDWQVRQAAEELIGEG